MSIDDPGWGGLIEEEPGARSPSAPAPSPREPAPPAPPAPPGRRRGRTALLVVAAVVVLGGAGAGVALGLGSSKPKPASSQTTTTLAGNTGRSGSTGNSGGNSGGGEPALLGVVPSALAGACTATPAADRVSPQVVDEVGCDAESVSGSSADLIAYVRFGSGSAASAYFTGLLGSNSLTAGTGDCGTGSLSGTTSSGSYCAGTYSDANGNSGQDLAFVGTSFDVGGAAGSSSAFCQSNFPGSSGASIVVWTSPSDDSAGFAVDCTASTASFVDGMLQNLVQAVYELND